MIPDGITVTITSMEDLEACVPILIFVEGELSFQSGKKLDLPCVDTAVLIEPTGSLTGGGGGGASSYITICGTTVWQAGDGDIIGGFVLLPIELCCFTGSLTEPDNYALLSWETRFELNNKGFWIEISADGLDWSRVGFVNGQGTSTSHQFYSYTDSTVIREKTYYRLIQIDFDGQLEIFDPILINGSFVIADKELYVFPNPVHQEQITVYVNSRGQLELPFNLLNMNGQIVMSSVVPILENEYCTINLPMDIPTGNYLLNVGNAVAKVVVVR